MLYCRGGISQSRLIYPRPMPIPQLLELAPAPHLVNTHNVWRGGHMKYRFFKLAAARLVLLSVILLLSIPVYVSAQGRGHGQGLNKKSTKFVNGHDARDGRFDGRGPRTSVMSTRRSGLSKKSTKFVNGHDARNGRWDGRGPGVKSKGHKPIKI